MTTIVAEIGINHNGDLDLAKRLIDIATGCGCNAVKFQKRTVDVVYTPEELAAPRVSPFGSTNGALKRGLEFGKREYDEIDAYCKDRIPWAASCWDAASADFIDAYDPPWHKVASACLTDDALLRHIASKGRPVVLSTGMSSLDEIRHALKTFDDCDVTLLHCCSAYPAPYGELNLEAIRALRRFGRPVGYSGHETGIASTVAAVALGATFIERHITIDRAMWGSDQAASLGPHGLDQLVREIRLVEEALGDGVIGVTPSEIPVREKLRRE